MRASTEFAIAAGVAAIVSTAQYIEQGTTSIDIYLLTQSSVLCMIWGFSKSSQKSKNDSKIKSSGEDIFTPNP